MREQDMRRLAEYVKETRKKKNLSQTDIRKRGGPSGGWIGALEAGTLPSIPKPETLRKLAKGLGVPEKDVFAVVELDIVASRYGEDSIRRIGASKPYYTKEDFETLRKDFVNHIIELYDLKPFPSDGIKSIGERALAAELIYFVQENRSKYPEPLLRDYILNSYGFEDENDAFPELIHLGDETFNTVKEALKLLQEDPGPVSRASGTHSASAKPTLSQVHESVKTESLSDVHELCGSSDQSHVQSVTEKQASNAGDAQIMPLGNFVRLPMYGKVNCGEPCVIPDVPLGYQEWPERIARKAQGVLTVSGSSMLAAGFKDGTILFIKKLDGERPQPGKKVIVNIQGDGCMCKYYREDDRIGPYLESAPGDGDPTIIHLTPEMTIIAQVLGHYAED